MPPKMTAVLKGRNTPALIEDVGDVQGIDLITGEGGLSGGWESEGTTKYARDGLSG